MQIRCALIVAGDNDRTIFDPDALAELANSIRVNGLASPPTVRPFGDGFQIVCGERRFRAVSQILGWEFMECVVSELSDDEAWALMLSENVTRADIDAVDEMLAYRKRIEAGWSVQKICEKCGVSKKRVEKRLLLGNVREDILFHIRTGAFPIGHAELLSVLDPNRQMIAARPIIEGKSLNIRQFREIVDILFAQQSQESLFDLALWGGKLEAPAQVVDFEPNVFPIAFDLPEPVITPEHHSGAIMLEYIRELERLGYAREAAAIGRLLALLTRHRYVYLPVRVKVTSLNT